MTLKISREVYASMYGPTTGDKVRLADSDLFIEVEKNYCTYGDEAKFGGGKTLRNAMGQSARATRAQGALDLVITNALIFDYWGIVKADVGIRDGKIVGIGKAGNPDIMADVDPNMVVGPTTEALAGEGKILTAGGIDVHVHYICPQYIEHGLDGGLTTLLGGGTGPNSGTLATTCTPGEWNIMRMIQSMDSAPMNFGFFAKGNASFDAPLVEQIKAGACAMKLHEDWGTTPQAIDACLSVADKMDVQVLIHTDTLNESGYVEDTIASFKGRTIHTFHTEGAGGGHAPDIMRVAGEPNCLPSSTNPTRPYTINTVDEHLDMLMVCHHLDSKIPEDVAFASSRIRAETIAAEDVFHDMGVISMIGSDSQAMGRIGEVWCRTFQTADKMKKQRGALPEEVGDNDNFRCKRFVAKVTINPAIAHGISQYVGSIEVGKIADLVLWRPAFFGIKPDIVMKNGMIVRAQMGDPNASIPTPQPVYSRPMYGAFGVAAVKSGFIFVSQAAYEAGIDEKYSLNKKLLPVFNCRNIGKRHMKLNTATPKITIDSETYEVRVDGNLITCEPAKELCMTQRYFLF